MRWWAKFNPQGYTLIELVVVVAIIALFFAIGFASLSAMYKTSLTRAGSDALEAALSTAAERARAGSQGTSWGVYFAYDDITRIPTEATVFSGTSYATRNVTYDLSYPLSPSPLITNASLQGAVSSAGNDHEIVFAALSGATTQYGTLTLTYADKTVVFTISPTGIVTRQ